MLALLTSLAGAGLPGCLHSNSVGPATDNPTQPSDRFHLPSLDPSPYAPSPTPPVPTTPPPQPITPVHYPAEPAPVVAATPAPPAPPASPPRPPDPPLVEALRSILEKHPAAAYDLLHGCDKANRDAVFALLRLAPLVGEGKLDQASPDEVAAALEQMEFIKGLLRPRTKLQLGNVCLCKQIYDFGKYDPLPPEHAFYVGVDGRPGEPVLIYAELKNFTCRARGNRFVTEFTGRVEIRDAQNREVWAINLQPHTDATRTPVQDCCLKFDFNLPADKLAVGSTYTLWVQVVEAAPDGGPPRSDRRSLDFRVRAPRREQSAAAE
jgi:hypothetical protein